jgi:hypothetical protein
MAAEPENRYASADLMANALDALGSKPRRLAIQTGILLLAAVAAAAWSWWSRPRHEANPDGLVQSTAQPAIKSPQGVLRIQSFEVQLYHLKRAIGSIGVSCFEGRYQDDDIRLRVRFSEPAYGYLIALNPDGMIQVCYPEAPGNAPSLATEINYPSDPTKGFGLTDGLGAQAFVVIASRAPWPSYAEWSRNLGALPWKSVPLDDVWRYDGFNFDREIQRGDLRPLADVPKPLEATCRTLGTGPGVLAIRALAFPVKPREESKNLERPGDQQQ